MIGPDKILSNWILAWYIVYMMGIVSISPKLPIVIGIIENIGLLCLLILKQTTPRIMVYFCIVVFVTKIIPLATLWNIPIGPNDWTYCIGVVIMYICWLYVTDKLNVYSDIFSSFTETKVSNLPGVGLVKSIVDKIENI
jgi:hypothetical protein